MAFSNWSQTLRIGLTTAISLGGAAAWARVGPRPAPCPLLGMYTVSNCGLARFYGHVPEPLPSVLLTLTEQGDLGRLVQLRPLPAKGADPDQDALLPGAASNLLDPAAQSRYRCGFRPACSQADPDGPGVDLGAVLTPGAQIQRTGRHREFQVRTGGARHLVQFQLSREGLHIRCRQLPDHRLVAHFYYYLGYEVEPDQGPN